MFERRPNDSSELLKENHVIYSGATNGHSDRRQKRWMKMTDHDIFLKRAFIKPYVIFTVKE